MICRAYILVCLVLLGMCGLHAPVLCEDDINTTWRVQEQISARINVASKGKVDEAARELKMLYSEFDGKPQGAAILNGLGAIYEKTSPQRALSYYQKAVDYKVPSDAWNFEEQRALQNLSRVYANIGNYKNAVETLSRWDIREPCGNGAAYSEFQKAIRMWELRMHCEDRRKVLAGIWSEMESGEVKLGVGLGADADTWALSIRIISSPKYIRQLEDDAQTTLDRLKEKTFADDPLKNYRVKDTLAVASAVLSQSEYRKNVARYDVQQLVSELERLNKRDKAHGSPQNLFSSEDTYSQWKEQLVIARISKIGSKVVTVLIESHEQMYNILALYALGIIGGDKSVAYLTNKAETEQNVYCLVDYYFCMLATKDPAARKLVEDVANEIIESNKRNAAQQVLRMKLPDISRITSIGK